MQHDKKKLTVERSRENALVASVIIPVYNKEAFLETCIANLDAQDVDHGTIEAIFVDDGSQDASLEMLKAIAKTRPWVQIVHQDNGGVCSARNAGIREAHGRYIFYLDPDDEWSPNVISDVSRFFDDHYDEVDLVTYRIRPFSDKGELASHFRYNILAGSGIYDLGAGQNCFICQTTMNVCVKNEFENNHTFDLSSENGVILHEDLMYITEIVARRNAIGYCEGPEYKWYRNDQSVTNTISKQTETFESTMQMYEQLFSSLGPSRYVQALFFTDLVWKFREGSLVPYQYEAEQLEGALERIRRMLNNVEVDVIVHHPTVDPFHRFFWLQQKKNSEVECVTGMNSLMIRAGGEIIYMRQRIEVVLLRADLRRGGLHITGYLKSPCFQFDEKPRLFARMSIDGKAREVELPLRLSSWSYYKAKTKTNDFWGFSISCSVKEYGSLWLRVRYKGLDLGTNFYIMPRCAFSQSAPIRLSVLKDGYLYSIKKGLGGFEIRHLDPEEEREFSVTKTTNLRNQNPKVWAVREIAERLKQSGRRIWLYHDCHGVEKSNAYYQFMHDIAIKDGVERYYVVNDPLSSKRHLFSLPQMRHLVQFGSKRHKFLFLAAEKVITAYVEKNNWMPFTNRILPHYSDLFDAEVIYLQHGVLHAHMPWKYSFDRLDIDREVVSTHFEVENLADNYGFDEKAIVPSGAPRYDFMDTTRKPKKKILFAPSWRGYLVKQSKGKDWERIPGALERSSFYKELRAFINSEKLETLLETYGFTLELKLHPIMAEVFHEEFKTSLQNVSMAADTVDESDYAIFITDFSSYRFDFVYLKRTIMYFLPDEQEFKAGLCVFRETDLPLGGCFGDMAHTADEAICLLNDILENGARPKDCYAQQMDDFFLHYDGSQRERIYRALTDGPNTETDWLF